MTSENHPLILSGSQVAKSVLTQLKSTIEATFVPCKVGLCVIQVGEDAASSIYVSRKGERAQRLGFHSETQTLSEETTQTELIERIEQLNKRSDIHGILVQLPLPSHMNTQQVLDAVDPKKDVDGFHPVNAGLLLQGRGHLISCTPKGVMTLLQFYNVDLQGRNAVVIGRSNIVGRPMACLLEQANCTVTLCHSRTKNLQEHLANADIVVAAVGIPRLIKGEWLKRGAVVIDVGINQDEEGKLCGDVDYESALPVVSAITPVPGGVGPMTIATLMENTWFASQEIFKDDFSKN